MSAYQDENGVLCDEYGDPVQDAPPTRPVAAVAPEGQRVASQYVQSGKRPPSAISAPRSSPPPDAPNTKWPLSS